MTLGRCPLSIFCSRGTPPSLSIKCGFDERHLASWASAAESISASIVSGKPPAARPLAPANATEREFFIDNLLVRIHFIIEMI